MKKGACIGLVFVSPLGVRMRYMVHIHFPSSNNVPEYEVTPSWSSKKSSSHNAMIAAYCREVHQLEDKFDGLELSHILRRLNEAADALAKMVSGRESVPTGIFASN